MFFPEDIWEIIKDFIIHKIKYGKHLKDDVYIKKFNKTIKNLPKRQIPRFGPRIMYIPKKNTYKNLYLIKIKNKYIRIIITSPLPKDYKEHFDYYDKNIRKDYYLNEL
jgi:hypothetical protein